MPRKTDLDAFINQVASVGRLAFDEEGTKKAIEIKVLMVPKHYLANIYENIAENPKLAEFGRAITETLASETGMTPGQVGCVMLHGLSSGVANLALPNKTARIDPAQVTAVAAQLVAFSMAVANAAEVLLMSVSHEQNGEG